MTTFNPGDKILFPLAHGNGTGAIQRESLSAGRGWLIDADDPTCDPWFAFDRDIKPIPADSPIFASDARVQVNADAPHYAGRTGVIEDPSIRDGMFGYWLYLTRPEEPAWVPAEALTALEGGEQR